MSLATWYWTWKLKVLN